MPDRVVVFLDYQNVYRRARGAFLLESGPPQLGQVDPLRLGQLIVSRSPFDRELLQVRVYRGQPDASKDPIGYAANLRQCDTWRRMPKVQVVTRTLRYPPGWPACAPGERPQEKGIDVALAIDFVAMAVRSEYDVGVIMSTDTDLKPALETVRGFGGNPRCEVAAWSASQGHSRRLAIPGARVWCHWLDQRDYRAVEDPTDYGVTVQVPDACWAVLSDSRVGMDGDTSVETPASCRRQDRIRHQHLVGNAASGCHAGGCDQGW